MHASYTRSVYLILHSCNINNKKKCKQTADDKSKQIIHSALKLEKSAISKVQKHIIQKWQKKSIFAPEKSLELPKMQF